MSCGSDTNGAIYQTSLTTNAVLYATAGGFLTSMTSGNSGILVTDGSGVPSINATVTGWTPVLAFGGGVTGMAYTTQTGGYYLFGQVLFFDMQIELSTKGSDTGTATVTGLPAINAARDSIIVISASNLTFSKQINARVAAGGSTISFDSWPTTAAITALTDTAFGNTTLIELTGFYLIS